MLNLPLLAGYARGSMNATPSCTDLAIKGKYESVSSPGDVRLTQEAFRGADPSIQVHVARDGTDAMAYLTLLGRNLLGSSPIQAAIEVQTCCYALPRFLTTHRVKSHAP